ncbi:MAG: hypothetical protein K0S37_1878 [Microbacterium sp.]|jgi:AraC-like DNA-binding protein|nr:hypothetical protein [Microbacterium sp.]
MEDLRGALAEFGWESLGDDEGLQLAGVGTPLRHVGRAWSAGGTYRSVSFADGLYVTLLVEGSSVVTYDGVSFPQEANQIVLSDSRAETVARLTSPTARYTWRFHSSVLSHTPIRERLGEPITIGRDAWRVAASLTNGAIEAPPAVASSTYLSQASELVLAAVLEDVAGLSRSRRSRRPDQVYGDAMQAIEVSFRNPSYGPTAVAADVLVSYRSLRRAFAAMGTTPSAALERRRTRELNELRGPDRTAALLSHAYQAAGFASVSQARAALQRQI